MASWHLLLFGSFPDGNVCWQGDGVVDYTEFCKSLVQQEKGDADDYFKGTGASQKSRPGASGSLFDADGEEVRHFLPPTCSI